MEASAMEQLVTTNARAARQLMGVPTLPMPAADDAALSLRTKALLRSLYPQHAPPPPTLNATTSATSAEEARASAVSHAGSHALMTLPTPTKTVTGSNSQPSTALPANATASSALMLGGAKRGRAGEENGDEPILSMDPQQLKRKHALVVASAAEEAVAEATGKAGTGYSPPPKWKLSKVLVGHQGWVWAAAVDPTNSWFATGGFDSIIKVWDLSTGVLKMNLTGHKEAVRGIALSPTSPYMFSASDDHAVKCWDLERNEVVREFFGHRSAVHCVAVHPTLDVVLSGGRDKTVRVWDVRTRACVHTLEGHTDSVMSLVTQQAQPQAISGGSDGMIYLWDVGSGKAITRLTRHKKPVRGLAMTPSGAQLVSCGADEIRFWKLPTGEFQCNASTIVQKSAKTAAGVTGKEEELAYRWSCCAVSPRNVLAVASQDGHVTVYDVNRPQSRLTSTKFYCPFQMTRTKSIPGTLVGEGGVNSVVFDASGTRMITAESDKSVKIWRLRDD